MVEEHSHILKLIAALPGLVAALRRDFKGIRPLAEQALDFIRNYADRYHHAKVKDILFGYFDPQSEILRVMLQDHEDGRDHVRNVAEGLASGDLDQVEQHLQAYGELLRGHIQRENEILYPWMDRSLSMHQIGELYARCAEVEQSFGDRPRAYEDFADSLKNI